MRLANNGRGTPPKYRSSSLRYWDMNSSDPDVLPDLVAGVSFGPVVLQGIPLPKLGPVGHMRRYTGAQVMNAADAGARSALTGGDYTLQVLFRAHAWPSSGSSTVVFYGSFSSGSSADHSLFGLSFDTTGALSVEWDTGSGTHVTSTFSGYVVPIGKWQLAQITVTSSGTVSLNINGYFVDNVGGRTLPTDGSNGLWRLGAAVSSGAFLNYFSGDIDGLYVYEEVLSQDELVEDARRLLNLHAATAIDVKLELEDGNGDYQNMTELDGVDWLNSWEYSDGADAQTMTASFTLLREHGELSLANLRTDSKLNLTDATNPASYSPLVTVNRGAKLYLARVPLGVRALEDDWQLVFEGTVDEVDWGGTGAEVKLSCRDMGGKLIDAYIEDEVVYGDPAGTAVEGEMQSILDNNSVANYTGAYVSPALYTPVAPGWNVLDWVQRREPVLSALRTLSNQIGYDCRYRWEPVNEEWRLTFFYPGRERGDCDVPLLPSDIYDISQASLSSSRIRNVVRVVFPSSEAFGTTPPGVPSPLAMADYDNEGQDSEGNFLPAFVEVADAGSIVKYGRRFMEIREASSSQIDTFSEATKMAVACCEDLREPNLAHSVGARCLFELELHDIPQFKANQQLYTADQRLAIFSVSHSGDAGGAKSSFETRGRPSIGFKRWMQIEARPGLNDTPLRSADQTSTGQYLKRSKETIRNLYNSTSFGSGGRFLALRNADFNQATRGYLYPPDGWFPVDIQFEGGSPDMVWNLADSLNGRAAVTFKTDTSAGEGLQSDFVQVEEGCPLFVEMTWRPESGTGDSVAKAVAAFYGADGTFISSSTLTGAEPDNWSLVGNFPLPGGWIRDRLLVMPPAAARLAKIRIEQDTTTTRRDVSVDSVALARGARKSQTYQWTGSGFTGSAGVWTPVTDTIDGVNCIGPNGTSYGISAAASGAAKWRIQETGRYRIVFPDTLAGSGSLTDIQWGVYLVSSFSATPVGNPPTYLQGPKLPVTSSGLWNGFHFMDFDATAGDFIFMGIKPYGDSGTVLGEPYIQQLPDIS